MDWRLFIAPIFIMWLLAMFYVGPSYFRRLNGFLERLKSHHYETYVQLGRPLSSISKNTMGSGMSTVVFLAKREYRQLSDAEIVRLGDSVRVRLLFWASGIIFAIVALPIAAAFRSS